MILLLAWVLITVLPPAAPAQSDPVVESRRHFRAAVEAYEAGDRVAYLEHAREAHALRPEHGGVTWALASALALTGDTAGAFHTLRHFAALGYFGDLAADSDFAGLRGSAAYEELNRRLEGNRTPVVQSRVAFEIPETDLLTEGIAYDSATGVFFVGSVRKGETRAVAGHRSDFGQTDGGTLWVAAAALPQVYRIAAGADSLERFVRSPLLLSAQGLALAADERSLYVADYSRGILRVNLADRGVTLLQTADSVLAVGIDGLCYHRGHLIGIQNGVEPHRVVRLTLAPAGDRILQARVLERAHPRHDEPTLGVVAGEDLFYVANSQWERFGQDGLIADSTALQRPVVLRLPL